MITASPGCPWYHSRSSTGDLREACSCHFSTISRCMRGSSFAALAGPRGDGRPCSYARHRRAVRGKTHHHERRARLHRGSFVRDAPEEFISRRDRNPAFGGSRRTFDLAGGARSAFGYLVRDGHRLEPGPHARRPLVRIRQCSGLSVHSASLVLPDLHLVPLSLSGIAARFESRATASGPLLRPWVPGNVASAFAPLLASPQRPRGGIHRQPHPARGCEFARLSSSSSLGWRSSSW